MNAWCTDIEHLVISEGCEVDANALAGCSKLKEVEISEKAAFVDPDAFAGLQNIKITYF